MFLQPLSTILVSFALFAIVSVESAPAPGPGAAAPSVAVNLNIDVNALIQTIGSAVSSARDRGAFVKATIDQVSSNTRGRYNVVVLNMQQDSIFNPNWQTTWFHSVNYAGTTFGVYVFSGGEHLERGGDGGWINWGMYGVYTRSGDGGRIVDFSPR
jgi:hypothetical protein